MKLYKVLLATVLASLSSAPVLAEQAGSNECSMGYVNNLSLDVEYGPSTQELMRCIERRHNVKEVIQLNQFCQDAAENADRAACTRPYGRGNIGKLLNDYEVTHGMTTGRDFELVGGLCGRGYLAVKDDSYNGAGTLVPEANAQLRQRKAVYANGWYASITADMSVCCKRPGGTRSAMEAYGGGRLGISSK